MYTIATKPKCPYCSFSRSWSVRRSKRKCKRCRREWSARFVINHIRATRQDWDRCVSAFLVRRSTTYVVEQTSLGYCQVVKMLNHLRGVMTADQPERFTGVCEADETFIGGQWRNKRRHIRKRGTKKGHGTSKTPIVGVYSRRTSQIIARVLELRNETTVIGFICSRLGPGAILYTDGYKMNRAVKKYGVRHYYVDHDAGEFVRGAIHTNSMEGFWGYLKRNLASIGGIRKTKLPYFVGEFIWRYNHRKLTRREQKDLLLKLLLE